MKSIMNIRLWLLIAIFAFSAAGCEKDPLQDIIDPATKEQQITPTPTNKFYDAFAYGDLSFYDVGLSQTDWGWITKYHINNGSLTFPIYIRDEHYDGGNGTYAGAFIINYSKSKLVVDYYSRKGFALMKTNLYVSSLKPTSIDPLSYTMHHNLNRKTTDRYSIYITRLPVFIIGHAVIVRTQ